MLEVEGLSASYGAIQAVRNVSFRLTPGQVLAVLGPNGAGKSTLANAVCGLHKPTAGALRVAGRDLARARPTVIARAGVTVVPQGRRVFGSCTVAEHVALAQLHARPSAVPLDDLLEIFPRLKERWSVRARQLSGGEQQMLAVVRAVLLGPSVLVLDEPTEGLAPSIVSSVGNLVGVLRGREVATLLMERPGPFPYAVADTVATMERGEMSAVRPAGEVTPTGGAVR